MTIDDHLGLTATIEDLDGETIRCYLPAPGETLPDACHDISSWALTNDALIALVLVFVATGLVTLLQRYVNRRNRDKGGE